MEILKINFVHKRLFHAVNSNILSMFDPLGRYLEIARTAKKMNNTAPGWIKDKKKNICKRLIISMLSPLTRLCNNNNSNDRNAMWK